MTDSGTTRLAASGSTNVLSISDAEDRALGWLFGRIGA
jgi:hypothetical protein